MLLAGLAVLAGILAAVFTFTDSSQKIRNAIGGKSKGGGAATPVALTGVAAYDPSGDQTEHDSEVGLATDRDSNTFWTTEHYRSFAKDGVGLVLDAGQARTLSTLVLTSNTPGFTAEVKSGSASAGPFPSTVGSSRTVGSRTTFTLSGDPAQYYLVWITDLGGNDAVHVNEVTAKGD